MTLPSSGGLSVAQILAELGDSYPVTIPNARWLALAGKTIAPLVIPTDFYGKSAASQWMQVNQVSSSGSTTFTFSGVTFGPAANKTVIIAVHDEFAAAQFGLSSAAIDGNAATIQVQQTDEGGSTGMGVALISATTASASGNVVLTFANSVPNSYGVGIATYYTLRTTLNNLTTAHVLGHGVTNISGTISMPTGGNIVLAGTGSTNTAGHNVTLTGATKQYDLDAAGSAGGRFAGGNAIDQSANASYAIGFNMGLISNSGTVMVAMAWN